MVKRVLKADLSDDERALIQRTENVIERAHAPVTEIQVGSAVLTERGLYEGCNVESIVSGLGICAERNAINHAFIHEGSGVKILALAVAWNRRGLIRPCGACLQYLHEFSETDVKIIMAEKNSPSVVVGYLSEMLPYRYEP